MESQKSWQSAVVLMALFLITCTRAAIRGSEALISSSVGSVVFQTTSVNNPSTAIVTLRNRGETEAVDLLPTFQGGPFSMNGAWPGSGGTCGLSLGAEESCTLSLMFLPLAGGSFSGSVSVEFFNGKGFSQWTATLSGSALPGGSIDSVFGSFGFQQLDFGHNEQIKSMIVQPDSKIIVAGTSDNGATGDGNIFVGRLTATGLLDSTFGLSGVISTDSGSNANDSGNAAILLPNGTIAVAGTSGNRYLLANYLQNGSLNMSFGSGGISVMGPVSALSVDTANGIVSLGDGRTIVAGSTTPFLMQPQFFAARIAANGLLDLSMPTFGNGGTQAISHFAGGSQDRAYGIAAQTNGQLLLAGSAFTGGVFQSALARINTDGSLDATFAVAGKVIVDICGTGQDNEIYDVSLDAGGMILVAGYCVSGGNKDAFVARYNYLSGTLDPTFGVGGVTKVDVVGFDDVAYKVLALANGKIVAGGYSNDGALDYFLLFQLNADGTPNLAFGVGGIVTTTFGLGDSRAMGMAVQPDGKIVLGGYSTTSTLNLAVARYFP